MDSSQVLFIYLAVALGLSAILGYVMRMFKLPLLVAYLLAGVILSLIQFFDGSPAMLHAFPEIGMAFVLFLVGMELNVGELKSLGKPIIGASLVQIIFSSIIGLLLARFFGFGLVEAAFLGIGLAFSSTIVVVKLLVEKKELISLYGKLSLGILLIEDLLAVLLLMVLTVGSSVFDVGIQSAMPIAALIGKGILLWIFTLFFSRLLLPRIFAAASQSAELLFLVSLAWCFVFTAVTVSLGFSVVIGAFLAGLALANSPFHYEVQGKIRPLRDFFVALFFIFLGSQIVFDDLSRAFSLILLFVPFALFVKPLVFMIILGLFGFRKHTIFQTALNLSQISEFSLIVMLVGLQGGMVSQTALTVIAVTGVLSMLFSSIMIAHSKWLYQHVGMLARFFERGHSREPIDTSTIDELLGHVIVIGAHRLGASIVTFFVRNKIPLLVIDFNPRVIQNLTKKGIHALYGDIGDPEIFDFLNLQKAKMIISTAQDREDSLILLTVLKHRKIQAPVVVRASTIQDARLLYEAGASYVILPEIVAADFVKHMLRTHWPKMDYFKDRTKIELAKLNQHSLGIE